MPLDMLDMLEDDGELAPSSLVRQLADAEVARQCRDLEEAIDGAWSRGMRAWWSCSRNLELGVENAALRASE
jgi:hypothetical protein